MQTAFLFLTLVGCTYGSLFATSCGNCVVKVYLGETQGTITCKNGTISGIPKTPPTVLNFNGTADTCVTGKPGSAWWGNFSADCNKLGVYDAKKCSGKNVGGTLTAHGLTCHDWIGVDGYFVTSSCPNTTVDGDGSGAIRVSTATISTAFVLGLFNLFALW